jgi:uncharacterized repeat protein (TIGR03803 family)
MTVRKIALMIRCSVLLIAAAALAACGGDDITNAPTTLPSEPSVPNVVGDTQAAAGTAITGAGLTVGTVTQASSASVASGVVISESPAAGIGIATGSSVNLVVSSGPPPVNGPTYTVGFTLTGLSSGASVTIGDNASTASGETLGTATNGSYTFLVPLSQGASYSVTVTSQPAGETCTVSNGSGIIGSADVVASISCSASVAGNGESVLYSFDPPGSTDGFTPGPLIMGSDGNLYGTTQMGGTANEGTVYRLTPAGVETILHSFGTVAANNIVDGNDADGEVPTGPLIQASDGNFYGVATFGGGNVDANGQEINCGTVFKVTPSGSFSVIYTFLGNRKIGGVGPNDGCNPSGTLVQGADGNLHGTTQGGGTNSFGTVFSVALGGSESIVYSFGNLPDGEGPMAGLILGADGNFYGQTIQGGSSNCSGEYGAGTFFKMTTAGVETVLYSFPCAGSLPGGGSGLGNIVQGSDGNFYGLSNFGGTNDAGTIYRITPAGVETDLHSFGAVGDGSLPVGGLVLGGDGNFYGTTSEANAPNNTGTIFEFTLSGTETVLYIFGPAPDGNSPHTSLVLGTNGSFYGTTNAGGANGNGTVFQFTP